MRRDPKPVAPVTARPSFRERAFPVWDVNERRVETVLFAPPPAPSRPSIDFTEIARLLWGRA
jgi:hypothetical protein